MVYAAFLLLLKYLKVIRIQLKLENKDRLTDLENKLMIAGGKDEGKG